MSDEELWRFEPETWIMDALLYHYDAPVRQCLHDDEEKCAISIVEWLRNNGVELRPVAR